jgi:DNA-directed RNA polymerase subunit E'/Rpb7
LAVSYYFTSTSKKLEAILKFREEKYSNLLILLQGFVGNTTSYETKKKFFEEQYKSWIYCSDEVVIAINELVQLVIKSQGKEPNAEEGRKAVGNIVLAMRKDLLGKTTLSYKDFSYTDVIK